MGGSRESVTPAPRTLTSTRGLPPSPQIKDRRSRQGNRHAGQGEGNSPPFSNKRTRELHTNCVAVRGTYIVALAISYSANLLFFNQPSALDPPLEPGTSTSVGECVPCSRKVTSRRRLQSARPVRALMAAGSTLDRGRSTPCGERTRCGSGRRPGHQHRLLFSLQMSAARPDSRPRLCPRQGAAAAGRPSLAA